MKTKATKLTYEAPETSVDVIEVEQNILISGNPGELRDMDYHGLTDDDDFSINY